MSKDSANGREEDKSETSVTVDRVRKFFPETWLFSAVFIGSTGQTVMTKIAPDTITTWLTSAFAVHPEFGLSLIHKPAELTTFREVFVTLDLPYSAVRGEDLCLKAFAFNYFHQPLYMSFTMGRNPAITNIRVIPSMWPKKRPQEYRAPMTIFHRIGLVPSNEIGETTFCFNPNTLGRIPIQVNLTVANSGYHSVTGDGLERILLVEPEGVPRVQAIPVILDVNAGGGVYQDTVPISFPQEAVSGSQRITVAVAGDLLGPVFDNLEDLLRMPYGCGEQNMLYFAPNVFLIDYLQRTNTYTQEVAEKAENFMLVGYQKELKYMHNDGSFSAFGQRNTNDSGSMWLTAFVTKCFAQSMALGPDVISVEPGFVIKSIMWMISKQQKDGSFPEPGKVFNKNMQGGSANGEALTAYVLIALAEAKEKFMNMAERDKNNVQSAIALGRSYLEKQLSMLNDSYDMAIVTYALHLTMSEHKDAAFEALLNKGISESLTLHWERPKPKVQLSYYSWQRTTDAINIEMTAYALLTFILKGDLPGALPIVRWMTSQRGPQGGFISTQDTVMGLQALSLIAADIYQPYFVPITVEVEWSVEGVHQSRTLTLDDHSKLLLHKVVVPIEHEIIPADITIEARTTAAGNFSGIAVAEVIMDYNVLEPTTFTTYSLVPEVKVLDMDNFVLEVTAFRKDGVNGGMTVIEVGIPTGYSVDEGSSMYSVPDTKMAEYGDRKYILYYEKFGADPVFATLPMTVTNGIPVNILPVPIKIYDYYESAGDQQMTVNYQLPEVKFICSREKDFESCPYL